MIFATESECVCRRSPEKIAEEGRGTCARERGIGRIIHIDRFGNLVTDLPEAEAGLAIVVAGLTLPIVGTYEDVARGELLAYIGSAGTVEIAVRDGRADKRTLLPRGTQVAPVPTDPAARSGPYR